MEIIISALIGFVGGVIVTRLYFNKAVAAGKAALQKAASQL